MANLSVSYDARAITFNGERTFLVSGAIHYPRSTPAMWPQLIRESKEAGLNTIETYVFWNLHERQRGVFDFSDRLDLYHFAQEVQAQGLNLILRIGPYICAETNYGGFPFWLRDVPGIQMRTLNDVFMREMERWVRFLVEYMRPLFASNGGPIILAQLENEYGMISGTYKEDGQKYLQWASDLGHDLQMGVPLIMCLGAAEGAIETINGFYGHHFIEDHKTRHPDQPAIWTEAWTGWYDTVGYPHHFRSPASVAYGTARFVAAGGTGVNYYMWHGGTNFDRSAMYLQTNSYDFDAPLNAYGQPTTKSRHLARLHNILHAYAQLFLRQEQIDRQVVGEEQCIYTYSHGDRQLAFLCNDSTSTDATYNLSGQSYTLAPQSVLILLEGQVLFYTAEVDPEARLIHEIQLGITTIQSLSSYPEPLPSDWPELLSSSTSVRVDSPVDQLRLTKDITDYCWYTTTLTVAEGSEGKQEGILTLEGVADVVHVFVDGQLLATSQTPLKENRGAFDDPVFTQSFALSLVSGEHTLSLLCCAFGLIKGDWMIAANMASERKGLWGQALWNGERLQGPWTLLPGLVGEHGQYFAAGGTLLTWQNDLQVAVDKPLSWWRLTFERPVTSDPLVVDLLGMAKGQIWLNGHCLGRYWLAAANDEIEEWQRGIVQGSGSGEPTQRYHFLPAEWLRDQNELILFEELGGNPASIAISSVAAE